MTDDRSNKYTATWAGQLPPPKTARQDKRQQVPAVMAATISPTECGDLIELMSQTLSS